LRLGQTGDQGERRCAVLHTSRIIHAPGERPGV
jgi:hypothetical protein